jgi:hypothetical protein
MLRLDSMDEANAAQMNCRRADYFGIEASAWGIAMLFRR